MIMRKHSLSERYMQGLAVRDTSTRSVSQKDLGCQIGLKSGWLQVLTSAAKSFLLSESQFPNRGCWPNEWELSSLVHTL